MGDVAFWQSSEQLRVTCGAGGVLHGVGTLEGRVHQELIIPQVVHLHASKALNLHQIPGP